MEAEEVKDMLVKRLTDNYFSKFGRKNALNEFSVSMLVHGPGAAMQYKAREEEPPGFKLDMFRGSAMHAYIEKFIPEWYAWKDKYVRVKIPYKWDSMTDEKGVLLDAIQVFGHPDASHRGNVIEFKTLDSDDVAYRRQVVHKAKRQVGFYSRALSDELGYWHDAFVVVFDSKRKTALTDKEIAEGKSFRNGFLEFPIEELTENDKKYKATLNQPVVVFKLTKDEVYHGFNYVRWCAIDVCSKIEAGELDAMKKRMAEWKNGVGMLNGGTKDAK